MNNNNSNYFDPFQNWGNQNQSIQQKKLQNQKFKQDYKSRAEDALDNIISQFNQAKTNQIEDWDPFKLKIGILLQMMVYNIMALFKHQVVNSNMMLSTLRFYCFALGSWITEHSNKKTLKISLPQKRRAWMDGLFENVKQSQMPFKYT